MPVVIVGAGVFGLGAALALTERGHTDITVLDRLEVPAEDVHLLLDGCTSAASTDINKMVRADYGDDTLYQTLAVEACKVWKEWNDECASRGESPLYHETGVLFATPEDTVDSFEYKSAKSLARVGWGADVIVPAATLGDDVFPGLRVMREAMPAGHFDRNAGWAESGRTIAFMAAKARLDGVRIVSGVGGTFTGLVHDETRGCEDGGVVVGVRTADGVEHYGKVILAAGAWMAELLPSLRDLVRATGQPVVHFDVRGSNLAEYSCAAMGSEVDDDEMKDAQNGQSFPVWAADIGRTGFYGFPATAAGIVKVANHGPGYVHVGMNGGCDGMSVPRTAVTDLAVGSRVPVEFVKKVRAFLHATIPSLNTLDIAATRMCWYTDSWDGDFYICEAPTGRGRVVVATGGSGHAFKFAPVLGGIVADVSSIDKAPNDTVFLGRRSLLKSVQSGFRLWHVTYAKMLWAINAKYDGL